MPAAGALAHRGLDRGGEPDRFGVGKVKRTPPTADLCVIVVEASLSTG
jgi:hypothetical protein